MIADSLTKGLPLKVFHQHTASMSVILYEDVQFSGSLRCFCYRYISRYFSCKYFEVLCSAELQFLVLLTL